MSLPVRSAIGMLTLLALAAGPVQSQEPPKSLLAEQVQVTAKTIENAFFRRMASLDPSTFTQATATSMGNLFPQWGFTPVLIPGMSYSVAAVDQDNLAVCIQRVVSNARQWNDALSALSSGGYAGADSSCAPLSRSALAPSAFPATISGRKVLNRQEVPVPTKVPAYPVLSGVDAQAITRPGLTLPAPVGSSGAFVPITVFNPYTAGPDSTGIVLSVTRTSVRTGFTTSLSGCESIAPTGSCTVSVRYDGANGPAYIGNLQMTFSNGAHATIGLLGTTP